jgi:hypothetical protein
MAKPDKLTKAGDTLTTTRLAKQTPEQFAGALYMRRRSWEQRYGVKTRTSVVGDVATIFVIGDSGMSPEQIAEVNAGKLRKKRKRKGEDVQVMRAEPPPPPEPEPEPTFTVIDDEAREFWRAVFLQSLAVNPMAPPEVHAANAKAATKEWQTRWGDK